VPDSGACAIANVGVAKGVAERCGRWRRPRETLWRWRRLGEVHEAAESDGWLGLIRHTCAELEQTAIG
jgi:hypothetical protein